MMTLVAEGKLALDDPANKYLAGCLRTAARTLQVKLLPVENRLFGRVFAIAGDPNIKNVRLPFVLTLSQS